jgi:peroxiredoxin/predicted 2-oxoglutarate/Fe(II)-dependent dioxygenase YbiX
VPLERPFNLPWPLAVGDSLPGWTMPASLGRSFSLSEFAGRPLVLVFLAADDLTRLGETLAAYGRAQSEFQALGANVIAVVAASAAQVSALAARLPPAMPLLADVDGAVSRAHHAYRPLATPQGPRLAPASRAFVADAGLRVLWVGGETAAEVLAAAQALCAPQPSQPLGAQAPVLLIPHVLPPDFCAELMAVWATQGHQESGFMKEVAGQTVGEYDPSHKLRRDHYVQPGPLRQRLMHIIFHRVKPHIHKAFAFEATRFEEFRIACYDASRGGYFRPHRDNTTPGTAHRVFAMSLNLNAGGAPGGYEGGYLRFPEYGPWLYRPAVGEAVIFSCSLMHEATDVTAGQRFVLLTFLYGEAQAALRRGQS